MFRLSVLEWGEGVRGGGWASRGEPHLTSWPVFLPAFVGLP